MYYGQNPGYFNPMGIQRTPMQGINPNNPMLNAFGGYQNFMMNFNNFTQQMNQDPRMLAQQMLNNGQMTQQQFEQYRMMANQIMGVNL